MSDKPENPVSLASSIGKVADGLKKQPVLLFIFGMAIVLLAAGALAFDNLRLVLVGLLILTLIGLFAWMFIQVNKTTGRERETSPKKVDIEIDKTKIKQDSHVIGKRGNNASTDDNVKIKITGSTITGSDIIGSDGTGAEEKRTATKK